MISELQRRTPPDKRGIPWEEYMEQQRLKLFAEARDARRRAAGQPAWVEKPHQKQEPKYDRRQRRFDAA